MSIMYMSELGMRGVCVRVCTYACTCTCVCVRVRVCVRARTETGLGGVSGVLDVVVFTRAAPRLRAVVRAAHAPTGASCIQPHTLSVPPSEHVIGTTLRTRYRYHPPNTLSVSPSEHGAANLHVTRVR